VFDGGEVLDHEGRIHCLAGKVLDDWSNGLGPDCTVRIGDWVLVQAKKGVM